MTKDQTRKKLRDAVVAEAVEKGFRALSVGGVVTRAKVSAGTVYVHFDGKEDMLQKVFLEIKADFHALMLVARDEPTSARAIRRMWFNMFDFVKQRPADFLFLELGNSARILTEDQLTITRIQYAEISDILMEGVADGTLTELDAPTVSLLLIAPAMQLARSAVLAKVPVTADAAEKIFARVWLSIAADGVPVPCS